PLPALVRLQQFQLLFELVENHSFYVLFNFRYSDRLDFRLCMSNNMFSMDATKRPVVLQQSGRDKYRVTSLWKPAYQAHGCPIYTGAGIKPVKNQLSFLQQQLHL